MRSPGSGTGNGWAVGILGGLALLAPLPLLVPRDDVLNFVLLVLLSITLAQSWNIIAGYAGQVNLGHAAFFGLGALTARTLWIGGMPARIPIDMRTPRSCAMAETALIAAVAAWDRSTLSSRRVARPD